MLCDSELKISGSGIFVLCVDLDDLVFASSLGLITRLTARKSLAALLLKKKRGGGAQLVTISGKGAGGGGVGRIRGVSFLSMPPSVAHRLLPRLCQRVSAWSRCGSVSAGERGSLTGISGVSSGTEQRLVLCLPCSGTCQRRTKLRERLDG